MSNNFTHEEIIGLLEASLDIRPDEHQIIILCSECEHKIAYRDCIIHNDDLKTAYDLYL